MKPLVPSATANIKHSPSPSQININITLKAFLPQFLLPSTTNLAFNKVKHTKSEGKTQSEETKEALESNSDMTGHYQTGEFK